MHLSHGLRSFQKGLHGPVSWVIQSNLNMGAGTVYREPQKAWGRVEATAQSWASSPDGLCVYKCVLPKLQSPRGTSQGLMQGRAQHGYDVPDSEEVGNQGTSFVRNLKYSRDPHILDSRRNNPTW